MTIDIDHFIAKLRAAGREELIHYAGAAHRDLVAWHMCAAYIADPAAPEYVLKSRALKEAHGVEITPEQIEAASASAARLRELAKTRTMVGGVS